jgi:hypothetical protein
MRIHSTIFIIALGATQLGATDCGQALKDPGFDLWCDGQLCAWTVERGSVTQVPTWNAADYGVELDGSDTAISQLSPVDSTDGSCLEFDLIADVDDNAEVDLNFDAFGDGTIDYTQRVPTSSWAPVTFIVEVGGVWSGMRFELAKHGSGHAVVAQLEAKVDDPSVCAGFSPGFTPSPAPLGGACGPGTQCGSGATCAMPAVADVVTGAVCVGCLAGSAGSSGCGSGEVCGLGDPISPVLDVPTECVASGAHQLGEPCIGDGECASGICTLGACSTCGIDGCGSGQTCARGWTSAGSSPFVCDPGRGEQTSGEPCAADADCTSGSCIGTVRMQCLDGRACSNNADCPFDGGNSTDALDNGPCLPAGIQGGSCQ